jgi:prepilin-type N-terminal cleavage/methylation domain-containing protein
MKNTNQSGFSLIELLLCVVIIGIIATISFPYLQKAKYASENGAMFATLRTMATSQIDFYSRNSRYATLNELNSAQANAFGTTIGGNIRRGNFLIDMGTTDPNDASLRSNFTITATKTLDANDLPYIISVSANGRIVQLENP